MHKLILGTFALSSAALVSAQTQPSAVAAAPAAGPAPVAAGPAKSKTICKSEDTMGSRLGAHKVCRTAAEWQAINRYEQDNMDQRLRRPHTEQGGG